ncbi:zinc-binding dehydrogenase [Stigmatella sp. ncwal1]|uniref:Zinc-binding dehydrogenase n=1 Tax=Stigmatella ashevillensis TaxID=2995309 RepID=A0ABT5DMM4_9BACT|nr:zinc-binding dehydrogenase [Stigmatella ashevillena]MDC0714910.1 zinc-binding dehydrogenase [Stigmatella ashevillena]
MKTAALPETMRALCLMDYQGGLGSLRLMERPLPKPSAGQLLVRVAAAPIHPADRMFLQGRYGVKKPLPVVPGFEGSGTVVAAGSLSGRLLVGRRVGVSVSAESDGTWAEYVVVPLAQCLPLLPRMSDEQGASLFVNPFSAWALMERARKGKHPALVQSAAASALGRMLLKQALKEKLPLVNIVRRAAQEELLRGLGAEHVVNSSEPEFEERLRLLCHELGVTLGFDAVAGSMTGHILQALPEGGTVVVYGELSGEECRIPAGELIFRRKKVEGFWLSTWLSHGIGRSQLRALVDIPLRGGKDFETPVRAGFPLESAEEALRLAASDMTEGKVFFTPNR